MRIKAAVLLLLFTLTLALGGCAVSPEEVVDAYYRYVIQEDFEVAYRLLCKDSKERFTAEEFETIWRHNLSENELLQFRISGVGVEDDRAAVAVTLEADDGYSVFTVDAQVRLVKEGRNWRIILSEAFGKTR